MRLPSRMGIICALDAERKVLLNADMRRKALGKKLLAVAFCVTALMGVSGVANAQQPPPEVLAEHGPEHALSICSFSGINDQEEGPGPLTQSYGQDVRLHNEESIDPSLVKSGPPSPGTFCNPQKAPPDLVGPFPEPVEE